MTYSDNVLFALRATKSYVSNINRLRRFNEKELRKFQNKAIRKMVRYAYKVPLYHKKYKKANVHPKDIRTIHDIKKLPLIYREDLRKNYPNGLIPINLNSSNSNMFFRLSTSGSTGKPISIFYNRYGAFEILLSYIRVLSAYGINWNKTKIAMIVDLKPSSIEHVAFHNSVPQFIRKIIPLRNIKLVNVSKSTNSILNELNEFKPEVIGSDPITLKKLSNFKRDFTQIKPTYLFSCGSMLDKYNRGYIEDTFNARIIDVYAATETGVIAFQIPNKDYYHINSDYIFLEILNETDKFNALTTNKENGQVCITRLYGTGTPIIRYMGLEDIVCGFKKETVNGFQSEIIENISGRRMNLIILSNGKTITPFELTTIPALAMGELKSYVIKQFKIIQHELNEIELLIVVDWKVEKIKPSMGILRKMLIEKFKQKLGKDVNILVSEVENILYDEKSNYPSLVNSNLN